VVVGVVRGGDRPRTHPSLARPRRSRATAIDRGSIDLPAARDTSRMLPGVSSSPRCTRGREVRPARRRRRTTRQHHDTRRASRSRACVAVARRAAPRAAPRRAPLRREPRAHQSCFTEPHAEARVRSRRARGPGAEAPCLGSRGLEEPSLLRSARTRVHTHERRMAHTGHRRAHTSARRMAPTERPTDRPSDRPAPHGTVIGTAAPHSPRFARALFSAPGRGLRRGVWARRGVGRGAGEVRVVVSSQKITQNQAASGSKEN